MATNLHSIKYGRSEIIFNINFKDRKTLAIHVNPDGNVIADAPRNTPLEQIKAKIIKRAKWIKRQQLRFRRYPSELPARKYISGEAFKYLGRQYTLKIEKNLYNEVKMIRGQLYVRTTYTNKDHIKNLVDKWFRDKANLVFKERFSKCLVLAARKINIEHDGQFFIRSMKTRWGSCSKTNQITLNPELLAAHKECIDYVIVHELCHVAEHNHSKEFYRLFGKVMPDWEDRKDKLETTMEHRAL